MRDVDAGLAVRESTRSIRFLSGSDGRNGDSPAKRDGPIVRQMEKLPTVYAISLKRVPHYEITQETKISEWRFSRLLNGRSEATPIERKRIAKVLGLDEGWLFETPNPPKPRILTVDSNAATACEKRSVENLNFRVLHAAQENKF